MSIEEFAGVLYEKYREEVDWKDAQGKVLPDWKEFRDDPNKKVQSSAWVSMAEEAIAQAPKFKGDKAAR